MDRQRSSKPYYAGSIPARDAMGVISFGSSAKYPPTSKQVIEVVQGNPRPDNYQIIDTLTIGNYVIAEIRYPDCDNYEGRKILVYEGIDGRGLREQKLIDPHFSDDKPYRSPIARFEPTKRGWLMALAFVKTWMKNTK